MHITRLYIYIFIIPYILIVGEDITTTTIRVCAALGWASDLQMVTSEAVKKGLTMAVDTDRPIVDCIKLAAQQELECIPKDHYLQKSKYL